jgi:hypothetical protein
MTYMENIHICNFRPRDGMFYLHQRCDETPHMRSARPLFSMYNVVFSFFSSCFAEPCLVCSKYSFNRKSHIVSIHYWTKSIYTLEFSTQSSSEVSCWEQPLDHLAIRRSQDELTSIGSNGCQLQSRTARWWYPSSLATCDPLTWTWNKTILIKHFEKTQSLLSMHW